MVRQNQKRNQVFKSAYDADFFNINFINLLIKIDLQFNDLSMVSNSDMWNILQTCRKINNRKYNSKPDKRI